MAQIVAWKCETTGKVFEHEADYLKLQRKIARDKAERDREARLQLKTATWFEEFRNQLMSIDRLPNEIIKNQEYFWAMARRSVYGVRADGWNGVGKNKRKGVLMPMPILTRFTTWNLRWSNEVSNSHNCPKNGVTNWCNSDKDKPTSYPGWCGRINWEVEWPKEWDGFYLGSDLFKGDSRINTGTGGGGGWKDGRQTFGYDVQIFAADWPGLAAYRGMEIIGATYE